MPRFNVSVQRIDRFDITVEADDEDAAMTAAVETLAQQEELTGSDYHSSCDGLEAINVEVAE